MPTLKRLLHPGILLAGIAFWFVTVIPSAAQTSGASIRGVVLDPSGRVVQQATITILYGARPVSTVQSDRGGRFLFPVMPAGTYSLQASAPGFAVYELPSCRVAAGPPQNLEIRLAIQTERSQVTVADVARVDVDMSSNAGATVLAAAALDALPNDKDDLAADLQALAGPAAGPSGGQIYIDGFTGGRLPSKQSIREIRVNQNPFAAQFDRPGQGRIEIFTKPGADEFHGELVFIFGDASMNSRNPFVTEKPPYQRRQWEGEATGPLGKKTSFFFDFERRDVTENAFVNAITLDSRGNSAALQEAIVTPLAGVETNIKIDRQLHRNHTLTTRYGYQGDRRDNQGVGGFSLPSRAYGTVNGEHTFQATETGILSSHTINETRFRFRRQATDQNGGSLAPAISVLDAFADGGSPVGTSFDHQKRYEVQNLTSRVSGSHVMRFGGLLRGVSLANQSMQNYAGTFTFTSLESYRATLLGLQQGLTMDQIRANGGGPSQFTMSAGNPLADVHQFDVGLFVQDEWRLRPNLALMGGLRYEAQNHASGRSDLGPRIGFAWGLGRHRAKPANGVIRGGFGIFYDRLHEGLTLDALRQDGVRQQQFLIPSPAFYPDVPPVQSLLAGAQPQTIRRIDSGWQAPMLLQASLGFERQIGKALTVSTNYIHSRGTHALRSRNINAPLPAAGVRPYGTTNAIYLYETSGRYRQHQWITNINAKIGSKLTLSGLYAWGSAKSDTDGAGTFPANSYDTSSEYSRAGFDVRHRAQINGSWAPGWGVRLSPFVTLTSGRPFNLITGRDLNGDGLFNDRPAWAADRNRPSVVQTPYGWLDTAPLPGATILPRNFANGPGAATLNCRLSKSFDLGKRHASGETAPDPKQITLSVNARNALNHPNLGMPVGNLTSLLFNHSTALAGGQGVVGTRRVELQLRFSF